jgi:Nickel responsive protein SCO4226-like
VSRRRIDPGSGTGVPSVTRREQEDDSVPRYLVQRNFGNVDDDHMRMRSTRSTELIDTRFTDITWEHSHVVTTPDGDVKTFCIYDSPTEALVHEHAEALGGHTIEVIFEIGGDVTPDDFRHHH